MTEIRSRRMTLLRFCTLNVVLLAGCSAEVGEDDDTTSSGLAMATPLSISPRATAVSEAGEPAFVRLSLTRRPKGPITIDVAASEPGEVTVVPSRVTFKPKNWDSPQVVTIRAVDDADFDGDQQLRLTFRATGLNCAPSPVDVLSVDDDYTVTGYVAHDVGFGSAIVPGLSGLNNRGQVMGRFYNSQGALQAFLWENGVATEIGSLGGSSAPSTPVDINDSGVVLGWSETPEGVTRFLFHDGVLAATEGVLWAINDRGHTVGDALYADGARTEAPAMGNGPSEALALNESDHATGFGRPLPFGWHPFLWAGAEFTDLGTLGGPAGQGWDINERDQIVGWMHNSSIRDRPFLYDQGQVIDLGSVSGSDSGVATSINNRGDIVGYDGVRGAPEEGWVGRRGQLTALSSLLVDGSCFQIIDPIEINDSGYIAGRAWDCDLSSSHGVLLEPIKVAR